MVWGAPIWFNEFIVNTIKLCINMLYLYIPIVSIYVVYKCITFIIKLIRTRNKDFTHKFDKATIFLTFTILLSIALLVTFFNPQQVIPDQCTFDSFTIIEANRSERISISNDEKLAELRKILNEYTCKRSLGEGITYGRGEAIEIDTTVFNESGRVEPMHIIISNNGHMRYSAGNTDFFYIIEDKEKVLRSKIISFIRGL
jgi:hypothetical protein